MKGDCCMKKSYKSFMLDTRGDAFELIRDRFGESGCGVAEKVLQNPAHKGGVPCGCIGYKDDRPVCMQAEMLRTMYVGTEKMNGLVGGLTCKVKQGCPLSILLETISRSFDVNVDYLITFGNSCCGETSDLIESDGGMSGPKTCTRYLWRAIRPLECAMYFIRRKLLKGDVPQWKEFSTLSSLGFEKEYAGLVIRRLVEVKSTFFDALMSEYVKTNEGVVCSRTAEEIEWIFGEHIKNGQCVLLAAFDVGKPVGYIIIKVSRTAKRCLIYDWFALNNNENILEVLLSSCRLFPQSMQKLASALLINPHLEHLIIMIITLIL